MPRPSLVTAHNPSMLIPALPSASPRSAKVPGRSSRETVRSFIGTSFRGPSSVGSTPTAARRQTGVVRAQAPSAERSAAGSSEENTTLERDAT